MQTIKKLLLTLIAASFILIPQVSKAQSTKATPKVSDIPALKEFADNSETEIFYIDRRYGIDVWLAVKGERVQVIYTEPNGEGLIMNGFLFGPDAQVITQQMVSDFINSNPTLMERAARVTANSSGDSASGEEGDRVPEVNSSPSERLWAELETSNYIEFGSEDAPVIYTFVDPNCPHCKRFWNKISRPYVSKGLVRVRLIPTIVVSEDSERVGAAILESSDEQQAWMDQAAALFEAPDEVSDAARGKMQRNTQLMTKWRVASVPFSFYRNKEDVVRMLRGDLDDINVLLKDLGVSASDLDSEE